MSDTLGCGCEIDKPGGTRIVPCGAHTSWADAVRYVSEMNTKIASLTAERDAARAEAKAWKGHVEAVDNAIETIPRRALDVWERLRPGEPARAEAALKASRQEAARLALSAPVCAECGGNGKHFAASTVGPPTHVPCPACSGAAVAPDVRAWLRAILCPDCRDGVPREDRGGGLLHWRGDEPAGSCLATDRALDAAFASAPAPPGATAALAEAFAWAIETQLYEAGPRTQEAFAVLARRWLEGEGR